MNTNERIKIFKSLMGQAFSKEEVDYFVAIFRRMGYFDHSLEVTKSLLHLTKHLKLHWNSKKSPYVVGMFHDLCKCDNYIHNGDGTYSYNPNVTIPGHAEKSLVLLAANEIGVTEEEKACIRWHMGAFDDKENWDKYGKAIEKFPNVLWTHTADMMAARIKGI